MQSKYTSAIMQICDEKNIDKEVVIEAVQDALAAAYRKDYGNRNQKVRAEFDDATGLFKVYRQFEVVEEVENPEAEKTVEQAQKINAQADLGDIIEIEVTPKDFGRIAAQTARQVIIQRIREAEREQMYKVYKDREGELLFGQVQRVEGGTVFVDLEKASVVLDRQYQIPGEKFYNGQRIKLYLEKVERTEKGPQIIISRRHPQFIAKLLELEVPEVAEGTVEVKDIAREAGVRTKISVYSKEEGIDPVGSCVGQKGVRIQSVTDEIGSERIDIVEWDTDPVKYLINALSPARIISIELHEAEKLAKVFVTEDQRSLAIGKNGQNVRLASILTGWEIDIEDFIVEGGEEVVESEEADIAAPLVGDEPVPEAVVETATEETSVVEPKKSDAEILAEKLAETKQVEVQEEAVVQSPEETLPEEKEREVPAKPAPAEEVVAEVKPKAKKKAVSKSKK
ncbi:MAG: transcription termination factor NusA [Candidatus Gracilibacteria bacterium]|nr:transcription termination factor NusA [Candidatus Gracilibacteria bacterium]